MADAIFLVAVSGGADSMALLAALSSIINKKRLFCVHVEHGLRPAEESKADAVFVSGFCKKAGINCHVIHIPPGRIADYARRKGTGIEAAARLFRRRALFGEAARLGDSTVILTAHTRNDMLETALMRVLRGAGPAGLAAMPVRNGKILRPLLSISRAGVTGYLKEKKIPWREDSTNNDDRFLRNRIRRHLIPLLDESFPEWRMAVAGMAATQTLAAAFISNEAIRRVVWKAANKYARAGSREQETEALSPAAGCSLTFTDADNFFSQPLVIREEALFGGIDRLLAGKAGSAQIKRSVIRQFCAGVVNAADLGSVRVIRKEGKVLLSRVLKQYSEQGFSLLIKEPGLYNLNRVSIELRPFSTERKKGAFYSCLPLTFRQSFKDDFLVGEDGKMARRDVGKKLISAVDRFGIAAFINPGGGVLSKRYLPASGREDKEMYTVTIINNKAGGSYV